MTNENEVTYEITKEIGVISESTTGWQKLLCLVSWNGREPKFDVREWSPDRQRMSRGMTFSRGQAVAMMKLLQSELQ
ncbi:MAG: hypothetical protein IJI87_09205 [Mogibacterium sp.]|nr:hypothetical protein [Mogibacterium sp.]